MLTRFLQWIRKHPRLVLGIGAVVFTPLLALWLIFHSLHRQAVLIIPSPTLLLEDVRGRFIAEVNADEQRKGFWPLPETIPSRIVDATLAAEDARFYEHDGVDWHSVARAVWQNTRYRKRISGASTIAMQVARLQDPGGRSYRRKLSEAVVARELVKRYGHEAVLRHYLLIAPYGNQYHGIVYAARRYFDKPLEDLTWSECALLVALPKLPGRMNILQWEGRQKANRRALYVLDRLRALHKIPEADYLEAKDLLPKLLISLRDTRPRSCLHAALAMEQALKEQPTESNRYLIRSTLDLDLQDEVQLKAWEAMQKFRPEGAGNVAAMVVERTTGRILAYLGSEDYFDDVNSGSIDYAQCPRSSGSTLKPFIYALGMTTKRYTAASLLTDVGMALNGKNGGYVIRNYDEAFLGPILYRNALANSRNIPAVQVLESVGVEKAYRHLCALGLSSGDKDPNYYGAGLAIGGLYVTLHDLVRAYGVLANDGRAYELRWFDGAQTSSPAKQLIPEDVARQITLFLSDPMARLPSFPRMGSLEYPFAVAVKTGTSQGYRDAWCVAYSEKYLVGVWMGHPRNYPMNHASGAGSAAELVHSIMETLHPEEMEGMLEHSFPVPRGWEAKRICMLSGKQASDDCPSVAVEWFKPGTEPAPEKDVHRKLRVDLRTGKLAASDCPPQFVQMKSFTVLDPQFSSWARESGLELLPPELEDTPESSLRPTSYRLAVMKPRAGILLKDPEAPVAFQTIPLEASVSPPAPQVIWYVDGKPYKVVDYPYTARWPMVEGTHTFQVRLPFAPLSSELTRITVKP
jgi:penicillin-binding protein 1C